MEVAAEFLAQVVTRVHQRPAGVLFLAQAKQIRRIADLRFDLLLAIAKIVVRDDGHHHPAVIAAGELERAAVVVQVAGLLPAHSVAALTLRRGVPVWQAHRFLGHADQVRRKDDAARVPGPMLDIQSRVILRQERIAGVPEDALHEIEVADEIARREEPNLHALLGNEARHFRADNRTQEAR